MQRPRSILVIDDDVELAALVVRQLEACGDFRANAVHDGPAGLAAALATPFDLIILDVMLPHLDGFEVLRQLRLRSQVPVILLTARTAPEDRVAGLTTGADDYLPKPFWPEELVARVRAILRRFDGLQENRPETVSFEQLRVSLHTRQAYIGDDPIELTETEIHILALLLRSRGRIVTRDEMTAVLHQRTASPFERSLDVHVSRLRKKLGAYGACIRGIRNEGYMFIAGDPRS
ncbi:MAG TPA: response regulator transcription factor [Vicinamibacterales bacterium]|nr:response regulator transcription factor [Vicinamibacterales bacterium]